MPKKKKKITSAQEIAKVIKASLKKLNVPERITFNTKEQLDCFKAILNEVPKVEWTEHKIEIAALLAKAICDLEKMHVALDDEGYLTPNHMGSMSENPRSVIAKKLRADICSMRRTLAIHERAKSGETRDIKKRRAIAKGAEDSFSNVDDDLIARPSLH